MNDQGSAIMWILGFALASMLVAQQRPARAPADAHRPGSDTAAAVPFRIVESRGTIHIAVISATYRTERHLRPLCTQVAAEYRTANIVTVMLFDNARAAAMYDRMLSSGGSLGPQQDAFYDRHLLLNYSHNRNTGHRQCSITLDGRQIDL
jgi:hypothetical protein